MQGAPIEPYFANTVNFTFEEAREGELIRLLRNIVTAKALPILAGATAGGLASHLRRIRDLDPIRMVTVLPDGTERVNTFFDLCCKVASALLAAPWHIPQPPPAETHGSMPLRALRLELFLL